MTFRCFNISGCNPYIWWSFQWPMWYCETAV